MDIPLNAEVKCADGTKGRSVCIIINPVNNEVTHLVIETKGMLGMEYMLPIDRIISSTTHQIQLRCTLEELSEMEPFQRSQFIGPDDSEYQYSQSMITTEDGFLWPYTQPEDYGMFVGVEQIPPDELGIHRGAHVEATDGRIGRVDEFIVNPENNHISHLIMRKGHLWGKKVITITVSDILRIEDDVVYLKLDKHAIKKLPSTPLR
jgi:uncharacterized protein YrrD